MLSEAKARHLVYADQVELPVRVPLYPDELERWIDLKDESRAFLRPLKLTDEPKLRELFYSLSPESVHYRFFRMIKSMPHEKIQEFLKIDYESDMGIVVLPDKSEDAPIIAIAHYMKEPRTNFTEAAFLVLDAWQGKGVGTALMRTLVGIARQHGIAGFTACVLAQNLGMLRVFHKCGYHVESNLTEGVYSLRIPFDAYRSQGPPPK